MSVTQSAVYAIESKRMHFDDLIRAGMYETRPSWLRPELFPLTSQRVSFGSELLDLPGGSLEAVVAHFRPRGLRIPAREESLYFTPHYPPLALPWQARRNILFLHVDEPIPHPVDGKPSALLLRTIGERTLDLWRVGDPWPEECLFMAVRQRS